MATQGHSYATPPKEALLSMSVGYVLDRYVQPEELFIVLDLNAGHPTNHIDGKSYRGTTQILLDKLMKRERDQQAALFWCDRSRDACQRLQREEIVKLGQPSLLGPARRTVEVVRQDNREFLGTVANRISRLGTGLAEVKGVIVADPNGLDVPLEAIRGVVTVGTLIDLFIHISGFTRVWPYWAKYPDNPFMRETGKMVGSFHQIFTTVPKRTWLISEVFRNGGPDHILLYGTNRPWMPSIEKPFLPKMYPIDSRQGIEIVRANERPPTK